MNKEEQFTKLYHQTYQMLLRYVIVKCDNLANVEDIVQNVYLKVYKLLDRKDISYFSNPMLIKLCKNELFRYYNLKNKFKSIFYDVKVEYCENIPSGQNIEKDLEIHLSLEEAWNMIQQQDLDVQKIAALYFLDDLSLKDISQLMHLNVNTVKSKLYRLIHLLKEGKGSDTHENERYL